MTPPDRCPHCRMPVTGHHVDSEVYDCGTEVFRWSGAISQTSKCYRLGNTRLTLIAECLAADLRELKPTAESLAAYDRNHP